MGSRDVTVWAPRPSHAYGETASALDSDRSSRRPSPDGPGPAGVRDQATSAATTSSNAAVCASTSAAGGRRAHQGHVVERRHEHAAVHRRRGGDTAPAVGSASAICSAPSRGGVGRKWYSARAPSRVTCQGTPCGPDHVVHARLPALGERDHSLECLVGEHLAERGSDRGQRQRVAGQGAADPADVGPRRQRGADAVRDRLGHPVRARRDPAADRLADHEHVRLEPVAGGHPAGPGADRVGLVDDQDRAGSARELAQGVVVAGLRQDDADVGQRRLDEDGRDILVGERPLERVDVVERARPGWSRAGSTGGPMLRSVATTRPSGSRVARVSSTEPW